MTCQSLAVSLSQRQTSKIIESFRVFAGLKARRTLPYVSLAGSIPLLKQAPGAFIVLI